MRFHLETTGKDGKERPVLTTQIACHGWKDGHPSLSGQPGTRFVLPPQLLALQGLQAQGP